MAKRQKAWARRARAQLMLELGGVCAECGAVTNLVFDCIQPTGDRHHRMDTSARMSYYRTERQRGNLQVLCDDCNTHKSAADAIAHQQATATTRVPRPAQGHPDYDDSGDPF